MPAGLPVLRHRADEVCNQGGRLLKAGISAVETHGYALSDFDWVIPHQANGHIAELLADSTGLDPARVQVTADRLGNLGSAAIWSALHDLRNSGRLRRGERVLVLGAEATKYLYGGFVYQH